MPCTICCKCPSTNTRLLLNSFPLKTSRLSPAITATQETEKTMIYEMRVYRCLPGRLPVLLKRFENLTLKLWEKHGIRPAGFFTTLIGESNHELTYMLAWESLGERET